MIYISDKDKDTALSQIKYIGLIDTMDALTHGDKEQSSMGKIKLWVVFLPVSPLIVMVIIYIRWAKLGKLGFNKDWIKTTFLILLDGFLAEIVLFAPLFFLLLYVDVRNVPLVLVLLYMYFVFTLVSLVIRDVEYKRVRKVFE